MFKIKSRFYVIYGDGKPIYVGYTNRTIHQRFTEHKRDKDFSDYDEVRVEELKKDELDLDFSWDYSIIENEADEVSKKEAELVKKFGTQDSEFQKADGGGEVWTNIKYFVLSNKDNPKYKGMNGKEIYEYLENRKKEIVILKNFVNHIEYPSKVILDSFVGSIKYPSKIILTHFVGHIEYSSKVILDSFVGRIEYPSKVILDSFIDIIKYPSKVILNNFVGHVEYPSKIILQHFVEGIKYPSKSILGAFVEDVEHPSKTILDSFINRVKYPSKIILQHFVGHKKIKKGEINYD